MQSIVHHSPEQIEQVRQFQKILHDGTNEELWALMRSVRAKYAPPEYLRQQLVQRQQSRKT